MKKLPHITSRVFLSLSVLICLVLCTNASAQSANIQSRSLLSPSTVVAGVVQSGTFQPISPMADGLEWGLPTLTCSPVPCALPDVQASEVGTNPVNEDPISANPINPMQLLTGGNDLNCANLLGFYSTNNGGSTWTHTCMGATSGTVGLGDPGVGYDRNNTSYIVGIDGTPGFPLVVVFEKSTDNGNTWSAPQIAVHPAISSGMIDKPWLVVDTTATSPHVNTLYISATSISKDGTQTRISVSHSTNGGASWQTTLPGALQTVPDEDQFSDLAVGKDGTVYVTWMHCTMHGGECAGTTATIFFSKSGDGGTTWSPASVVANVDLAPHTGTCSPASICGDGELPNTNEPMINVPVIGVDNSNGAHAGSLYVAMYDYTGTPMHSTVKVARSSDGGATWSVVRVASVRQTHDQFFPWLSVSSAGIVGVTWLDRRNDPANISYQPFAAVSTNGGVGFGSNFVLSSGLSNPFDDGWNPAGTFMGDYTGNVWVGKKLYTSWMDSNNGARMQDEAGGLFQ